MMKVKSEKTIFSKHMLQHWLSVMSPESQVHGKREKIPMVHDGMRVNRVPDANCMQPYQNQHYAHVRQAHQVQITKYSGE
jgi:hypothetical protein